MEHTKQRTRKLKRIEHKQKTNSNTTFLCQKSIYFPSFPVQRTVYVQNAEFDDNIIFLFRKLGKLNWFQRAWGRQQRNKVTEVHASASPLRARKRQPPDEHDHIILVPSGAERYSVHLPMVINRNSSSFQRNPIHSLLFLQKLWYVWSKCDIPSIATRGHVISKSR